MTKLFLILFLIFILIFTPLFGEKIGVLTDVLKPDAIDIGDGYLYVIEGATVFVYSLDDLNLAAKFGKKGEGPGEIKIVSMIPNTVKVFREAIFVEGLDKIIIFSKNFKFLKEIKKGDAFKIMKIVPLGKDFLAINMLPPDRDKKYYTSLVILDSEMNKKNELHRQEFPESETDLPLFYDTIHFAVYQDKIYVEKSPQGFVIEVFDLTGNSLYVIKKDFEASEVTKIDKDNLLRFLKEDKFVKMMAAGAGGWDNFKKRMNFVCPENFPAIKDIMIDNDKIYVATFKRKENKEMYIVMDLKGNILNTIFLPLPEESSYTSKAMGRENRFWGIIKGKFYYLKLNENLDEWELFAVDIE